MGKQRIIKRVDELIQECNSESDEIEVIGKINNEDVVTMFDHKANVEKWKSALNEIKSLLWKG